MRKHKYSSPKPHIYKIRTEALGISMGKDTHVGIINIRVAQSKLGMNHKQLREQTQNSRLESKLKHSDNIE